MCSFIFTNRKIKNLNYVNHYLQNRGPDNTNHIKSDNWEFVHNLLSITGEFIIQPFIEENIACVFNGEIYNAESYGNFKSDGEVLIKLYKEYGDEFTKKLDGEFAIALLDKDNEKIIISTDVFSTKPLWYSINDSHIGVASYESALTRMGFENIKKIEANTTIVLNSNTLEIIKKFQVFNFDINNQTKDTYEDWNVAFEKSISKRTKNIREKVFIGLSSGYDSGAICCELIKQKISFKSYSLTGSENQKVLKERYKLMNPPFEHEIDTLTPDKRIIAHDFLIKNIEDFKYKIHSSSSDYNEFDLSLKDDNGSNGLSYICSLAKRDGKKIYISGQGADEIFADYGFNGIKKYKHSNFGGLFPKDLNTIFPWASFYGSSQVSYLCKEEYVSGGYGIEGRYPFLDPQVIQEFLWLKVELKNKYYKSVLYNYLIKNKYPFSENEKIGF